MVKGFTAAFVLDFGVEFVDVVTKTKQRIPRRMGTHEARITMHLLHAFYGPIEGLLFFAIKRYYLTG